MNHTVRGQTTPHLPKISCNTACFKQRNDTEGATVTTSGCESFRSHSDTLPGFEHWMLKARAILTLQGAGQQVVCMCLTQEVQQQGLYMIIKRSSMVKKKCPETTPLCSKPRIGGLCRITPVLEKSSMLTPGQCPVLFCLQTSH